MESRVSPLLRPYLSLLLLIPCDPETDVLSFNEMVQEVNVTQLQPEEVLTDNAYIYDGNEMKIIE